MFTTTAQHEADSVGFYTYIHIHMYLYFLQIQIGFLNFSSTFEAPCPLALDLFGSSHFFITMCGRGDALCDHFTHICT